MRRLALALGGLALGVALTAVFFAASHHVVPMNSDNATLALEGQSMRSGDVSLSGWALALDSFWTSEAPVYALGLALGIASSTMLYLAPALIAAVGVGVAMWIAHGEGSLAARLCGPLLVLALLGAPPPGLAFYLLQGSWHVGTAVLSLVVFAAVSARRRLGVPIALVALVLALLGDLETLLFCVAPLLGAGVLAVVRAARHLSPDAKRLFGVGIFGSLIAFGLHKLFDALGSYHVLSANPTPPLAHELANVARIPAREAGLAGVVALPVHTATGGPLAARLLHGLGFSVVIAALVLALVGLLIALWRGRRQGGAAARIVTRALDDLLLVAVLGDLADFVVLSGTGNGNYARYLSASVLFGTALAGRAVSRLVVGLDRKGLWRVAGVVVVFFGCSLAAFAQAFTLPAAAEEPVALGVFLKAHGLTHGVGDYWSSSIVTAETNGAVVVRPVIEAPTGRLLRYGRQSASQWYQGAHFGFLVFDTAHPWRGVDLTSALATFGRPSHVDVVGSYRVLVYAHPFIVSAAGYSRGAAGSS